MESKPSPSILTSNPFEIFTTPFARYHLFRQIDANSPLSQESEIRVLATLKFHQELMDDLSAKESRQLLALARNAIAEPWPLPESKTSGEDIDEEALQASLRIMENSSQPMVTSTPLLLEGTTSVPTSSFPAFSVDIPRFRGSHILLVGSLTASFMSASMCFSDSICATPLPVAVSAPCVSVCGVSLAGTESVFVSAARSSKGKNLIISTSKRKIDDTDEVIFVSETRAKKKSAPSVFVRMTRSKTGSVLPKFELSKPAPKSAPTSSSKKSKSKTFQPVLLYSGLSEDWQTNWDRSLLFERKIIEEDIITHCNVLSLFRDQKLLHAVQNIGPYSPCLIPEFYTNLQEDADDSSSAHFHEIFIRNKWYPISPASINKYLNRSLTDFAVTMSTNSLAGILTHNQVVEWPTTGLRSQNLTAVYSVLLRLATTNWLPSVNANLVYEKMEEERGQVLENEHFYRVDPRLAQGHHHVDRASHTASASAPGSSAARSVPLPPPAVVMHRQMASSIETSLALLRTSIAAQQDAAAGLEHPWELLVEDMDLYRGCEDFCDAHGLQENDVLIFRHVGYFKFHFFVIRNKEQLDMPEAHGDGIERQPAEDGEAIFEPTMSSINLDVGLTTLSGCRTLAIDFIEFCKEESILTNFIFWTDSEGETVDIRHGTFTLTFINVGELINYGEQHVFLIRILCRHRNVIRYLVFFNYEVGEVHLIAFDTCGMEIMTNDLYDFTIEEYANADAGL
nr:uncharacterized protein LOC109191099 [Ipomoea batatas]